MPAELAGKVWALLISADFFVWRTGWVVLGLLLS
jgi:hypothetical protein